MAARPRRREADRRPLTTRSPEGAARARITSFPPWILVLSPPPPRARVLGRGARVHVRRARTARRRVPCRLQHARAPIQRPPTASCRSASPIARRPRSTSSGAPRTAFASPAAKERIDALLASAQRLEGIGRASAPEYAPDGNTAIVRLQIDAENDSDVPLATGERLIALAEQATGDGLQVAMAGWAISNAQESEVSPEVVGFAIAALVLLHDVRLAARRRPAARHRALRPRHRHDARRHRRGAHRRAGLRARRSPG